ncbi:MAG: prenyltransferase/squalene oxidase repeat-containing protein [Gemmataceae bacterium]
MVRWIVPFLLVISPTPSPGAAPPDRLDQAIARGLRRLETGAAAYVQNRQCFSCHHQTLTIASLLQARHRGFAIDGDLLQDQVRFTRDSFQDRKDSIRKGENVGGRSTTAAYALHTLQLGGHPADEMTNALVQYLVVRQEIDGSWPAQMPRVPSEGSKFTNATLALAAFRHYASIDPTRNPEVARAYQKGSAWLLEARPESTEDRVFHLRGLVDLQAPRERIEKALRELASQQLPDGAWRQIPLREGDAYATATVLLALRHAGIDRANAVYRRGIGYLLRTQTAEGAWIVTTRNRPIQRWFDNGDPGGKHQFISFLATGWATLALLDACPPRSGESPDG